MKEKKNKLANDIADLDKIGNINKISVSVEGKELPLKIGDRLVFPEENGILKTITGIQINESGIENYLLEWFDDDQFKQYWISLTELKLLKNNQVKRNAISLMN